MSHCITFLKANAKVLILSRFSKSVGENLDHPEPTPRFSFLESFKLFVEGSKTLPNDFCMKTSVTVTANMQICNVLGVTLGFNLFRIIQVLNEKANGIF